MRLSVYTYIACPLYLRDVSEKGMCNQFPVMGGTATNSPVTGLEWPGGFQEFRVPRFRDNGTGW